ncbi:MAG: hypothetical protein BroJett011_49310 [Chloroflexota bacterium]|nr:MAG: hypothetical protein BroJett011_49310 [Chloroflexota bacterium]
MARAEINSGICGFTTQVEAQADPDNPRCVYLTIESECKAVQRLAAQLTQVDPFKEFSYRGAPQVLQAAPQCLSHAACPVPSGIIKTVEVAANLALPADVTIKLSKD